MRRGGYEVMEHPFFNGINWRELENQVHEVCLSPALRLRY
jgi:hypothetical protein